MKSCSLHNVFSVNLTILLAPSWHTGSDTWQVCDIEIHDVLVHTFWFLYTASVWGKTAKYTTINELIMNRRRYDTDTFTKEEDTNVSLWSGSFAFQLLFRRCLICNVHCRNITTAIMSAHSSITADLFIRSFNRCDKAAHTMSTDITAKQQKNNLKWPEAEPS